MTKEEIIDILTTTIDTLYDMENVASNFSNMGKCQASRHNLEKIVKFLQEPSPKIRGWVARNQDGELWIHSSEPLRDCGTWQFSGGRFKLDNDLYPTLSWYDSPIEVELIMNRV